MTNNQATLWRDAESTLVAIDEQYQLHLRHFTGGRRNTTVVLLHGMGEDGNAWFGNGATLAPQLVEQGFDVWVPELRGRGRSWPPLATESAAAYAGYGFHAAVTEDLATVIGHLRDVAADKPLYLVGHGAGGLLWLSFLARWPIVRELVRGIVLIGAATQADQDSVAARLRWWRDGLRVAWLGRHGVVPGRAAGLGPGVDPRHYVAEMRRLLAGGWVDPVDGLDHAAQLRELPWWPPTLVLAAEQDAPWGGAAAARTLQLQLPPHDGRLYVWPRASGVRLLGPASALAGGTGSGELEALVLDWLARFDG